MLKRFLLIASLLTSLISFGQSRPTRDVIMPTEKAETSSLQDYANYDTGFYAVGELNGGPLFGHRNYKDLGFIDLSFIGGYRFGEYLRAGLGIGARLHIDPDNGRAMTHKWSMPVFIDLRGNFIPTGYRNVVPYWSFDIGGSFPDGFMIRPTFGLRIGQKRSAFLVAIGYMGQAIRCNNYNSDFDNVNINHPMYSGINLSIGYEY